MSAPDTYRYFHKCRQFIDTARNGRSTPAGSNYQTVTTILPALASGVVTPESIVRIWARLW